MEKHETPPPYNAHQNYQPQPGYGPPQAGWQPQQGYGQPPPTISAPPPQPQHTVTSITVNTQPQFGGPCPVCHAGSFESGFTLCGWLCCIFCFPCGIICCFCMRKKKCNHCGFSAA